MGGAIGVWSHGLAPEAHSVSTQKMCDFHVPGWTTQGREREGGMGKVRERVTLSHTIVYLDGEESSALIIWRWSARLPGGRVGSTPNESTSGASGKSRCETSSGGRIATTRPQQHPLSRMVAIPTGVD